MKQELNMGKDSIGKLLASTAIPAVIGMLLQSIYMMIDGIFVGQGVGPEGLAAVNLAMPYLQIGSAVAFMIGVGGSTYTSIARGAGDDQRARRIYSMAGKVLVLSSVVLSATGMLFSKQIASILGASPNIEAMVAQYVFWLSAFMVFFMASMYFDSGMRILGRPMKAMYALGFVAIANIALDYLLIMVLDMGVQGAAIATGIAQMGGFLFLVGNFTEKDSVLKLQNTKIVWRDLKPIIYNGSSEFATGIALGISTFLFNWILMAQGGALAVSAYSIVMYIAQIVSMIYFGVATGMQPIISYNHGAGDQKRVGLTLKYAMGTVLLTGLVAGVILFFNNGPLS